MSPPAETMPCGRGPRDRARQLLWIVRHNTQWRLRSLCVLRDSPSSWAAVRETEAEKRTAAAAAGSEARAAAAARRAGLLSRIEELEVALLQIKLLLRRADHHRKRNQV